MYILGISAFYHDSAACLLKDGEIIAAAQEERFTRKKHDAGFPENAIRFCVKEAAISPDEIDNIVFYEKPFLKFERILETYLAFAPRGFISFCKSLPVWIKEKLFQKKILIQNLNSIFDSKTDLSQKLLFSEHHLSHAASAFFPSPFEKAAVLTMDGVGEWATTSVAVGEMSSLKIVKEIHFPHSLGLLYSAFTYYLGFKVNSGEYKVMGLAPYGEPKYVDLIKKHLITSFEDGSFQLNMRFFDYCTGLTMTNKHFDKLFGGPPRKNESEITHREMDLAASLQKVTEEMILRLAKNVRQETGLANLCLAGGVALNCVANGILKKAKIFDNIWIQPAAGDAGGALGASLAAYYLHMNSTRTRVDNKDTMKGAYLGPSFSRDEIIATFEQNAAIYSEYSESQLTDLVCEYITEGKAIGWMQGKMEFGPRALGARSIIADPRSAEMQKKLNLKVKFRESFRPFAPSILAEQLADWFDLSEESPYMLLVADVLPKHRKAMTKEEQSLFGIDKLNVARSAVPAITHVDYSARIQTVHADTNPKYYSLLTRYMEKTGCPMLINTSFNIRGEPIVCSPKDAYRCFLGTDLDVLVIENFVLLKSEQPTKSIMDYKEHYELD